MPCKVQSKTSIWGKWGAIATLGVAIGFFSPVSHGKELSSRLGIGFRNTSVLDVPSLAATYYPSPDTGIVGSVGIDTEKDASRSAFMFGARRLLFREENMNFFMGGNIGMLSAESTTGTDSGFELSAVVGAEFFLQGLENLGFTFETGVAMTNIKKVRFRTLGDHFLKAGMVFYF